MLNLQQVSRTAEIDLLTPLLAQGQTQVLYVHGIAGIGKTTLLKQLSLTAPTLRLDCSHIEPTDAGLLKALSHGLGETLTLEGIPKLSVPSSLIVLDNYESLKLLDVWVRQCLVPKLPKHLVLVICSRQPPQPDWFDSSGWQGQFQTFELGPLNPDQSRLLLQNYGVHADRITSLLGMAQGHPLALYLAACGQHRLNLSVAPSNNLDWILDNLTQAFLADVEQPALRYALEASSVARRLTKPLLRALLQNQDVDAQYQGLQALAFVTPSKDGLYIHDLVRTTIARAYKASDPEAYRYHQQRCWWWLQQDLDKAAGHDYWRHTADLLYLVENPRVREAFFPTGSEIVAVEAAQPSDYSQILEMAKQHDGAFGESAMADLWKLCASGFGVVRNSQQLDGFACVFEVSQIRQSHDLVLKAILEHLDDNPVPEGQTVLIVRRWLSHEVGESPTAAQGAFWQDCKRLYMTFKPSMRRIYVALNQLNVYQEAMQVLGFTEAPSAYVELDGTGYHCMVNDMGPGSVDGWLTALAERELGIEQRFHLFAEGRRLNVDGTQLDLTPLEYGVMQCLLARPGRTVSRTHLLQEVWQTQYQGGSNVVDAVVRTLRKKLGPHAEAITTVTSVGYRLDSHA